MTFSKDLPLAWRGLTLIDLVRFGVVGHPQPHARPPAVSVDELDAGFSKCLDNDVKRRAMRPVCSTFKLTDRDIRHTGPLGQFLLAPIK